MKLIPSSVEFELFFKKAVSFHFTSCSVRHMPVTFFQAGADFVLLYHRHSSNLMFVVTIPSCAKRGRELFKSFFLKISEYHEGNQFRDISDFRQHRNSSFDSGTEWIRAQSEVERELSTSDRTLLEHRVGTRSYGSRNWFCANVKIVMN